MNDDVLVVAVSSDGKHIALALLDCTVKVRLLQANLFWCFILFSIKSGENLIFVHSFWGCFYLVILSSFLGLLLRNIILFSVILFAF